MNAEYKRFFVSGGAGVIGSELVRKLVLSGVDVLVGDLKPRPAHFPASVGYRQGDLNTFCQAELDTFAPDVFIHLAATFERSAETEGFWDENFWHNMRLSHHLMTLVKQCPSVKRVVFASSYLVYEPNLYLFPEPPAHPFRLLESHPIRPRNLTGMAKLAHEIELRFIDQLASSSLSIVCARIFRGYGRNSRDVISRWIRMLLQGQPITVYQPEGFFDYIYAADSAEGLLRLAQAEQVTGIINLGTGKARRVQDVVNQLSVHFPAMKVITEQNDQHYEASQADMTRFQEKTGWLPEYTLECAIPEILTHEQAQMSVAPTDRLDPVNILLSSASRKIPLLQALREALNKTNRGGRVIAGDVDKDALSARIADEFWQMPPSRDEYIHEILQGCKTRNIRLIVPTRDGELLFWARHSRKLSASGIQVLVSPEASLQRCLDKLAFSAFGETHQLPFIPSCLQPARDPHNRWVVKERYGAGSRALGLNLDQDAALAYARQLNEPIFQPFIEGDEISMDAWLDQTHQVKGLVLRRREGVLNGESQVTTTFRDLSIESKIQGILETLQLRGPVVMQGLLDAQRQLHIIECNPRFGGASTASLNVGLDSLYWSIQEALGHDLSLYSFVRLPDITQIRIPHDIVKPACA